MLENTLENLLGNLSFGLLFINMLIYWWNAAFSRIQKDNFLVARQGMVVANLFLTGWLIIRWIHAGHFPLSNLYESLMFLTWGLTVIHLLVEQSSFWVGVLTTPIAMLINAFATLSLPPEMQEAAPLVPALRSNWLIMHVTIMMLSYAALLSGSLMAIAFLVVTKGQEINFQDPSGNQSLQFASNLDNLSYRTLGIGFPLLTIGIISGAVWANEAWGSYWSWDPKETWALITWLIFAIYLHLRITRGWQGKLPAMVASGGFIIIWICYLGVNLLGKGLHSYGWITN
uniref:Cytochrome c biogenesis protein CcsA n=1 Tax=Nephroselmis astigmatica TaxID=259378 RepID=A0A088CKA8_9CHLO|nr:heme attachment to plastid cytochrome c [Nephroselmis astigmatica]AID67664.1 heme attachment to plastid cytochrome c [Nephroselmis astigmatica]